VEPFFLEPHGGELNGFFLVRGERDVLARVRASQKVGRVVLRAGMVVQRVGVVDATTGDELHRKLAEFGEATQDLT
jgi:uncharacterized protein with GYD domain